MSTLSSSPEGHRPVAVPALMSVTEVAERLGTSQRFIRRLIAERRLPFAKIGKHVRFAASDLETFIAAGRVEANDDPARRDRRPRRPLEP